MNSYSFGSNLRELITGLNTRVPLIDGRNVNAINFDNAATTPPFVSVLNELMNYAPWYSSIHRGIGYKSEFSSKVYEGSREVIMNFVKADREHTSLIFVKNTTEAINKLSFRLSENNNKKVVLSSYMEHHSNDLPWRKKFKVDYIALDNNGRLSLKDLEKKLMKYRDNIRLVTVTGASNVTGFKNPIYKIAELSHKFGAELLVDGAQLVPHVSMDMKPASSFEHIDYLVFSAHKMYAPFGIGVLIGPKKSFERGTPDYKGGGTVKIVTHSNVIWDDPPAKDEAGSPNIMGVVALVAAIKTLNSIGMNKIESYERELADYTLENLKRLKDIEIYGDLNGDRIGIITFNIEGIPHYLTSTILSCESGISVRSGCFCAQPYVQRLLNISPEELKFFMKNPDAQRPGMVRISFGLYNTYSEVDILINTLKNIIANKDAYDKKYRIYLSDKIHS